MDTTSYIRMRTHIQTHVYTYTHAHTCTPTVFERTRTHTHSLTQWFAFRRLHPRVRQETYVHRIKRQCCVCAQCDCHACVCACVRMCVCVRVCVRFRELRVCAFLAGAKIIELEFVQQLLWVSVSESVLARPCLFIYHEYPWMQIKLEACVYCVLCYLLPSLTICQ